MNQLTYCLTPFMVNQVAKIAECLGALEAQAKTGSSKQSPASASISSSQIIAGNTLLWELISASRDNNRANKAGCRPQKIHNVAQAYAELESYSPYEIRDLQQAHRLLMINLIANPGQFRIKGLGEPCDKQASGVAPEPQPPQVRRQPRRPNETQRCTGFFSALSQDWPQSGEEPKLL